MATIKDLALKIHQRTSRYTNLNQQIQDNAGNINTNLSKISTIEGQVQELQDKANALRGYKEYNANEAYSVGDIIEAEGLFKVIKAISQEEEHPELSDPEYFVSLTEVVDHTEEIEEISTELATIKKMTKKIKFDTVELGGVEYPFVSAKDHLGYHFIMYSGYSNGKNGNWPTRGGFELFKDDDTKHYNPYYVFDNGIENVSDNEKINDIYYLVKRNYTTPNYGPEVANSLSALKSHEDEDTVLVHARQHRKKNSSGTMIGISPTYLLTSSGYGWYSNQYSLPANTKENMPYTELFISADQVEKISKIVVSGSSGNYFHGVEYNLYSWDEEDIELIKSSDDSAKTSDTYDLERLTINL